MARRLQLHEKLCEILGTRNVYFQPPASVKLNYDCIVYKEIGIDLLQADDKKYRKMGIYEAVFITHDPDSNIPDKLLDLFTYISLGKPYPVENLHHYPFTIYY